MKIILATITILLSLTFAFGQTSATKISETDWLKLAQAFRQVLKDAEGGFSAIRGKEVGDNSKNTPYEVTKNRLQPWSFDVKLTYSKTDKTYQLEFDSSQKNVFPLAQIYMNLFRKDLLGKFAQLDLLDTISEGEEGDSELVFNSDTIADFQYSGNNKMYFVTHSTAWKKINQYLAKLSDRELARLMSRSNSLKKKKP